VKPTGVSIQPKSDYGIGRIGGHDALDSSLADYLGAFGRARRRIHGGSVADAVGGMSTSSPRGRGRQRSWKLLHGTEWAG
jgi:hypothetical protein